jgi:hypothetical protein
MTTNANNEFSSGLATTGLYQTNANFNYSQLRTSNGVSIYTNTPNPQKRKNDCSFIKYVFPLAE